MTNTTSTANETSTTITTSETNTLVQLVYNKQYINANTNVCIV